MLPSKINISDFSLLKMENQSIFKFSLFVGGKVADFEMVVMSAGDENTITVKDEVGTFL